MPENTAKGFVTWEHSPRGFRIGRFTDRFRDACVIQESSLATESAIWLGPNEHTMHLTQDQVKELLPALQHFVEYGRLP